jgi:YaiO family outer membrane protein
MKKLNFLSLLSVTLCLVMFTHLGAQIDYPQRNAELNLSYNYLMPAVDYSDWKGAEARYSHRFDAKNALAFTLGGSQRDQTFAYLSAGIYRDWLPRFYTYSSLGTASHTMWMSKFRVDNELNYKMGKLKQYILTSGQSVIYTSKLKQDYIISMGGVIYMPHWVIDGKYFFNRSDPDQIWSNTTRISLSAGTQKKTWTTLSLAIGAQAYQGSVGNIPVDQKVQSIDLGQLIWLNPEQGIKLGAGYQKVVDAYDKYEARIGYFLQIN